MRERLGVGFACIALVILCAAPTNAEELELWYEQPATKWVEALPVGNGRLGAMVFGSTLR